LHRQTIKTVKGMKKILSFIIVLVLGAATATAATTEGDAVITVKASKAGKTLVEAWAEAYRAVRPWVDIRVVTGKTKEADLTLTSVATADAKVVHVGRYALLPVTSAANPLRADIEKRTWSARDLRRLFFTDEEEDEDIDAGKSAKEKLSDKLNVVTGSHSTSWTPALAAYFGRTKDEVKGSKVAGDDYYLLSAIEDDPASVTFSSLTFLYDLSSRSLRQEISLLPLNVKKEQNAALGNLDSALDVLERQHIDAIPVEYIGLTASHVSADIDDFLEWVVSDGQQYNHSKGFLRLDEREAKQQIKVLANR
jgi:hypothetical protein